MEEAEGDGSVRSVLLCRIGNKHRFWKVGSMLEEKWKAERIEAERIGNQQRLRRTTDPYEAKKSEQSMASNKGGINRMRNERTPML